MKKYAVLSIMLLGLALLSAHAQTPTPTPSQLQTRPRTVTVMSQPTPTPTPAGTPTLPAVQPTPPTVNTVTRPSVPPATTTTTITPVIVLQPGQVAALPTTHTLSLNKIRAKIVEAERLLKTRIVPTAMTTPAISFVTIAALEPETSQIHLVTLLKETFLTKDAEVSATTSLGTPVRVRVIRANGVNTAVTITDSANRTLAPLVVEYHTERGGVYRETAYYTSAHPALLSPEVVKAGQTYVRTMIDLAARRLRDKGQTISPRVVDMAERLCLVEHVDHDRFRKENNVALFNEIFSLYALNELDTYRYSVSFAGAGGMVQMIAPTYRMVRNRHPGVGLNPDFVLGMRNHGNALEAMLLYMQDTWNDLVADPDIARALTDKIATPPELLAAGYNSNPARLALYIRRGGAAWRTLIPRETQIYLQIYRVLDSLVPMKPRS